MTPKLEVSSVLTLAELEALASLGLTGLFAFHGAGVAGHEAVLAQQSLVVGVNLNESAGDSEAQSFGLAFVAAAVEVYVHVVLFSNVEKAQGLFNDELKNRRGKYTSRGRWLMVMTPLPSLRITRATAALRRPTALTFSILAIISFC